MKLLDPLIWLRQYRHLKTFRRQFPERWPARSEEFPPGNRLGEWCAAQNDFFRRGRLPAHWVRDLLKSGFPLRFGVTYWDPVKEERIRKQDPMLELFLWRYESLKEFRRLHPHGWPSSLSANPEESSLGVWVRTVRLRFARNQLLPYQSILMGELGILERPGNPKWHPNYLAVKRLIAEHGKKWRIPAGEALAGWALTQSNRIAEGTLSAEKTRLLRELGEAFLPVDRWGEGLRHLLAYRRRFPDRWPATGERNPEGYDVGLWCNRQRKAYKSGRLKVRQIKSLQDIGFSFTSGFLAEAWMRQYGYLRDYRKKHPEKWPVIGEEFPSGNALGGWCALQKTNYRSGGLEAKRIELLNAIEFPFQRIREEAWKTHYRALESWRRRHPDRWPVREGADSEERRLEVWLVIQRQLRNRRKLSPDRERQLMRLGMVWDPREARWIHFLQDLQAFRRLHRQRWPTSNAREEGEKRLGSWCEEQRKYFREGRLNPRRKEHLDRIRFPWEIPGHPAKGRAKKNTPILRRR